MSCESCNGTGIMPRPQCLGFDLKPMCTPEQQDLCGDVMCQFNDQPMVCERGCPVPKPASAFKLMLFRVAMYLQANAPWVLIILDRCLEPFGIELGFH